MYDAKYYKYKNKYVNLKKNLKGGLINCPHARPKFMEKNITGTPQLITTCNNIVTNSKIHDFDHKTITEFFDNDLNSRNIKPTITNGKVEYEKLKYAFYLYTDDYGQHIINNSLRDYGKYVSDNKGRTDIYYERYGLENSIYKYLYMNEIREKYLKKFFPNGPDLENQDLIERAQLYFRNKVIRTRASRSFPEPEGTDPYTPDALFYLVNFIFSQNDSYISNLYNGKIGMFKFVLGQFLKPDSHDIKNTLEFMYGNSLNDELIDEHVGIITRLINTTNFDDRYHTYIPKIIFIIMCIIYCILCNMTNKPLTLYRGIHFMSDYRLVDDYLKDDGDNCYIIDDGFMSLTYNYSKADYFANLRQTESRGFLHVNIPENTHICQLKEFNIFDAGIDFTSPSNIDINECECEILCLPGSYLQLDYIFSAKPDAENKHIINGHMCEMANIFQNYHGIDGSVERRIFTNYTQYFNCYTDIINFTNIFFHDN